MIRVSVTVGLLFWTQVALADCPGHISDLKGIELSRTEPFLGNVYRQMPEGLTEARIMERDGAVEAVSTVYLHALAPGQRISDKGTLVLDYSADPSELQRLDETKDWASDVVLKVNGQTVLEGRAEKRLAGTETITIGDCRTKVWLVEDRLELGPGDGSWMLLSYAPDLGLVVRSVTMSADGTPLQGVEFDTIRVLTD
jgi:hypothetical protein